MKHIHILLLAMAAALTLTSCKGCQSDVQIKQNVSGKPGEIIVVTDKDVWDGKVGETIRGTLEAEYQILPQPEPAFTLYDIAPTNFTSIFWIHRNILIINIGNDVKENKILKTRDVWASPQTVIKINAVSESEAEKLVADNIRNIADTFEQAERDRIIANNIKFQESKIRPAVIEMTGGSPYFPMGYSIKKGDDKFMWISYETTYVSQYVFIYKYPVTGSDDLSTERIMQQCNAILKENVPGPVENSYMTTAEHPAPLVSYIKYKKREFAEVRGLWEVQNDYMGGPYVLHAFYDREGKNVIVLHAFVYAPKYDKRNYLRQVESIIYSFEWDKN